MDKRIISSSTGLDPRDIQYITDKYYPPQGDRVRGRKLTYTPKQAARFGIVGELKRYGMTIKAIMEWVEAIDSNKQWISLFDDTETLKHNGVLKGKTSVFFQIHNADPNTIKIILVEPGKAGKFMDSVSGGNVMLINITDQVLLAKP